MSWESKPWGPGKAWLSPACLGELPQSWEPAPDPATAGNAGHGTGTSHLCACSPELQEVLLVSAA